MASIDRHQYSEEIRRGAAKFVKDLNLDTKPSVYVPRKSSVNGENGMLKKVQQTQLPINIANTRITHELQGNVGM